MASYNIELSTVYAIKKQ